MEKIILIGLLVVITKFSFSQENISNETWRSIGNPDCIELKYETSFIEKVTENGCTKNKYKVVIALKNNSNKDLKAEKVFLNFFFNDNCLDPNSTDALFMQRAIFNENEILISPGQIRTGSSNVFLPIDKKPEEYDTQWEILIKAKGGTKGLNYNKNVNANFLQKNISAGTFKDYRDGQEYNTIRIGNQIWFAENLAYKPSNGNYWAYNDDQNNVNIYGYLYDWETAKKVCPTGWHLPTENEWIVLENYLGGNEIAGGKLKMEGTSHWLEPNTGADNSYGFSALPAGYRDVNGIYHDINNVTGFLTSSDNNNKAINRSPISFNTRLRRFENDKRQAESVRCLQD